MAFPTFYISLFQSGNQCLFVVSGLFKFEHGDTNILFSET